jgi:hypothetical protein
MSRVISLVSIACLSSLAFGAETLRDNEAIIGGGSSEVCGFWISGPSIYLRRDHPGVACGMVKRPGAEREFSFVLLTKGDEKRSAVPEYKSSCRIDTNVAVQKCSLEIEGKRLDITYEMDNDPGAKPKELLTINGTRLNPKDGRVLLVDFSGKELRWKQINVPLPVNPTAPVQIEETEKLSRKTAAEIKRSSPAVREFFK